MFEDDKSERTRESCIVMDAGQQTIGGKAHVGNINCVVVRPAVNRRPADCGVTNLKFCSVAATAKSRENQGSDFQWGAPLAIDNLHHHVDVARSWKGFDLKEKAIGKVGVAVVFNLQDVAIHGEAQFIAWIRSACDTPYSVTCIKGKPWICSSHL